MKERVRSQFSSGEKEIREGGSRKDRPFTAELESDDEEYSFWYDNSDLLAKDDKGR